MEHPKGLRDNLAPDEQILATLRTASIASKPDWAVLTDTRVIYFNEKHLGMYDLVTIPYSQLKRMQAEKDMLKYASLVFQGEDGKEVHLKRAPSKDVPAFIDELERAMNRIAVEPISIMRKKGFMGKQSWVFEKTSETLFRSAPQQPVSHQTPLEVLNLRYARGEITMEEYENMRRALGV